MSRNDQEPVSEAIWMVPLEASKIMDSTDLAYLDPADPEDAAGIAEIERRLARLEHDAARDVAD